MGNSKYITQPASSSQEGSLGHEEGPVAKAIEKQTAKLPSDTFLWAALGSIGLSLVLEGTGHKEKANFVAHWAPTFLLLGVYNKIVKLHGSDGASSDGSRQSHSFVE